MRQASAPTIGDRIRERRELQGMTVTATATAAGIDKSTLSRIERGIRSADNRFILADIARALRCQVAQLTGERASHDPHTAAATAALVDDVVRAAREADPEYIPKAGHAPSLDALGYQVSTIRRHRVLCEYHEAAKLLPEAIRGAHAALSSANRSDFHQALRLLILANEAAASVVRYLGTPPAMALVAERMRDAARLLEAPIMSAYASYTASHASLVCGAYEHARLVSSSAAEAVSAHQGKPEGTEVFGQLMLTAAFASIGTGHRSDVPAYLTEIERLGEQTGDTTTLDLFFGPSNTAVWKLSMITDSPEGDPREAVSIARTVSPDQLPSMSRRVTWHVDTGRALAHSGRNDETAWRMLATAEQIAPARVDADPIVSETVRDLAERRKRAAVPPDLRQLCARVGVPV
jgi:transcriptional regulator with XRE-family HTH domain